MNENYRIFGKIISVLNKDYPPRISKKFTDRVMSEINKNKMKFENRKKLLVKSPKFIIEFFIVLCLLSLVYYFLNFIKKSILWVNSLK